MGEFRAERCQTRFLERKPNNRTYEFRNELRYPNIGNINHFATQGYEIKVMKVQGTFKKIFMS